MWNGLVVGSQASCIMQTNQNKKVRKIAIVGAGPSGLCCAKNAVDFGFDVTVYERNAEVGGTWIYTDRTGNDEYGMPIHSSMYKGLRYGNCSVAKLKKNCQRNPLFTPHV